MFRREWTSRWTYTDERGDHDVESLLDRLRQAPVTTDDHLAYRIIRDLLAAEDQRRHG